ncbi:MAG: hypothetical protein R3Y18_02930 [Bacillota bacterium]
MKRVILWNVTIFVNIIFFIITVFALVYHLARNQPEFWIWFSLFCWGLFNLIIYLTFRCPHCGKKLLKGNKFAFLDPECVHCGKNADRKYD